MPIVHRVFRYADGREERDSFDAGNEQYGVGEIVERDGIRWKAIEGRTPNALNAPNHVELTFVPDD